MKITLEEKQELEEIYQQFLNNEKIQKMKEIPQHRGSNCYIHSFKVAKVAIRRALRHKKVNLKHVLIGAILHDYYLYDWRVEKDKKMSHLHAHPDIALKNAEADFVLDKEVKHIIKTHMWPINIKDFPTTKEARIVNLADDHVALVEALSFKKYKESKMDKYYQQIAHLFD